jgi:hypothetical protein
VGAAGAAEAAEAGAVEAEGAEGAEAAEVGAEGVGAEGWGRRLGLRRGIRSRIGIRGGRVGGHLCEPRLRDHPGPKGHAGDEQHETDGRARTRSDSPRAATLAQRHP